LTDIDRHERRREIVRAFSDGGADRWEHFTPDFQWRMIGTTPVSGTMVGVDGVAAHMKPFAQRMASLVVVVDDVVGEGNTYVKIAHSEGITTGGQPYRNEYATVFRFQGDKITEVVEYLDTSLIERVVTGSPSRQPEG
jgi:ketosteroid isomerase-like protein